MRSTASPWQMTAVENLSTHQPGPVPGQSGGSAPGVEEADPPRIADGPRRHTAVQAPDERADEGAGAPTMGDAPMR